MNVDTMTAALLLAVATLLLGCETPSSVCEEYGEAHNQAIERCALPCGDWTLVKQDGEAATCDDVAVVHDRDQVAECLDWLNDTPCEDIPDTCDGFLAARECSASAFGYYY